MNPNIIPPRKAAAVHDMSGYGRCALSVIMPVLSAAGIQCLPMPTALFSAHTGVTRTPFFVDLTELLAGFSGSWHELGVEPDAIYTGFLGSAGQIDVVAKIIESFRRPDGLVLVDPVMGDNGKLYSTITKEHCAAMTDLVRIADVVTPNVTEAAFITGCRPEDCTSKSAPRLLERLVSSGPAAAVITGIYEGNEIITASLDTHGDGEPHLFRLNRAGSIGYPGTGDIFASVLLAGLMDGKSLADAAAFASLYVRALVELTAAAGTPAYEGVLVERLLYPLMPDRRDSFFQEQSKHIAGVI